MGGPQGSPRGGRRGAPSATLGWVLAALVLVAPHTTPVVRAQDAQNCKAALIEDLPSPIHESIQLKQKSALRVGMVGFTNRAIPGDPGFSYPKLSSDRIPVVTGEALETHLTTPLQFLRNCTADFKELDVLITRGCKCVPYARKANMSLVIGAAKPHDFLHGHGGEEAPSASCLRKLDFVISDNGTMKQRLESYGTRSLQLKLVEQFPPEGVQHFPSDSFSMRKPAKVCYHGNWNHFNNLRMRVLMGLSEKKLGVPFEFLGITNPADIDKAKQSMSGVTYKYQFVPFNDRTLFTELQDCDIGLVPQVRVVEHSDINAAPGESVCPASVSNSTAICQKEDVHWRFKMSHNAGRAFVFLQLGVPTIGEAVPEHAEVVGANKLGISLEESTGAAWTHAIKTLLTDACLRRTYSERSRAYAEQHLRPDIEATRLLLYTLKLVTHKKAMQAEHARLHGGQDDGVAS